MNKEKDEFNFEGKNYKVENHKAKEIKPLAEKVGLADGVFQKVKVIKVIDIKEATQNLQEELEEINGIQQIEEHLHKSFKGTIRDAFKNGYEMDKHYVIVDWVFFHKLLKKEGIKKAFKKHFGDLK